jgi:hypothetical protein
LNLFAGNILISNLFKALNRLYFSHMQTFFSFLFGGSGLTWPRILSMIFFMASIVVDRVLNKAFGFCISPVLPPLALTGFNPPRRIQKQLLGSG